MFNYLKGKLAEKTAVEAILDCNGIGYEINIPLSTYDKLPEIGDETKFYIHYAFSEMDGPKLYGFSTTLEKALFKMLISISKIGPKIGLAILSGLPTYDFINAIRQEDVYLLSTIPGIGKKSAERLIIELKDKINKLSIEGASEELYGSNLFIEEAETALLSLGYKQNEIRKTINSLMKNNSFASSEELIKEIIKTLYKKRK